MRRYWWLVLAAIAVTAAVTAGAFCLTVGRKTAKYEKLISEGQKYYAAMDFEAARIAYQNAIELDPEQEEGYEGLVQAYVGKADYDSAMDVIKEGIRVTNGKALILMLGDVIKASKMKEMVADLDEEQLIFVSANVALADDLFGMVAAYSYRDYANTYGGNPQITADEDGRLIVQFADFDGKCIFYDLPNDPYIVDENTGKPYENKSPNAVVFTTLESIFTNFQGAVSSVRLKELLGYAPEAVWNEEAGRYEINFRYKKCALNIETDAEGNIVSPTAWNEICPLGAGEDEDEEGNVGFVEGLVINAVTGNGMSANLKVRAQGQRSGEVLLDTSASSNGSYRLELKEGNYLVEVTASGFITEFFEITVQENVTKSNENFTISPTLAQGEVRVVLEWGAEPQDLDTHAIGTSSSGVSFHISYTNRSVASGGNQIANLDVDDRDGYGPETFTLYDVGAEFNYQVFDFTQSGTIGGCGATVKVYLPGQSPVTYQSPAGSGNTWNVFTYQNGEISLINRIEK